VTPTPRIRELEPHEFAAPTVARRTGPTGDLRFLAPDHPFLRTGSWRAFAADRDEGHSGIVASLDPRQRVAGGPVGAIGFIDAGNLRSPSARDSLSAVLDAAEGWLAARGAVVVRGPLQFATWYGHRIVTAGDPETGGSPSFPMEPAAVPGLGDVLISRGYRPVHAAASYRVDVDRWVDGTGHAENRMRAAGFRDRPLRTDRLDDELATLHDISSSAFRESWAFSSVTLDEFATIYRPLVPLVDADFVRILDGPDGAAVGYFFAFPDPSIPPGNPGSRIIAKTVAVIPEVRRSTPGLGAGLAVAIHRRAAARGYQSAVHACVAVDAYSARISSRWGERIRSYATFEKALP
jgi:hypothetical protein